MDRTAALWTLVVFFAGSILFRALLNVTEGESTAVVVGVQVGALALAIALLVVVVRRLR